MTTTTTTPALTDADLTTKIDALTADRERLTTAGKPSAKSAKAGGIPLSPARGDTHCQTLSFARASTAIPRARGHDLFSPEPDPKPKRYPPRAGTRRHASEKPVSRRPYARGDTTVLARGTGPDDVTTCWSADAAARRLGIRWHAAKAALDRLKAAKLVTTSRDSTKPRDTLAKKGDPIILPNTLVDGVRGELPPLRRVRQMQDAMTLRLLIDLYRVTDLPAWGGIDPAILYSTDDREPAGQRGVYVAWRFSHQTMWLSWGDVTKPYKLAPKDIPDGRTEGAAFWDCLTRLMTDGLLHVVPMVCEGENGEALFPLAPDTDIQDEADLYAAATAAGQLVVPDWDDGDGLLVPLPQRIAQPAMRGIFRLRYRPQTKPTGIWYADHVASCRAYLRDFQRVLDGDTAHSLRFGAHGPSPEKDAA